MFIIYSKIQEFEYRKYSFISRTQISKMKAKESKSDDQRQRSRSRDKNKQISHTKNLMTLEIKKKQQSDDEIDIFADSPEEDKFKQQKQENKQIQTHTITDQSGYYNPVIGNVIGEKNKYKIVDKLGRGVFGIVLKCERIADSQNNNEQKTKDTQYFAIKILRKNKMTQQSGQRQYKILQKVYEITKSLNKQSKIMKVFDHFMEKGHLCLVCELLSENLRDYTHKKQPTLHDIRLYAISMMMISNQLRNCKLIHADIKPDNFMFKDSNMLDELTKSLNEKKLFNRNLIKNKKNVEEQKPEQKEEVQKKDENVGLTHLQQKAIINNLKLVDFGTSYWIGWHMTNTQYMVARYYRAPQIILGTQVKQSQAYAIDVWAIGCSLFQLYTNQFLFNGNSNNEMLKLMMQSKGKFSLKMLNKSAFKQKHFDSDYNFLFTYVDKFTKQFSVKKMQVNITPERQLMNMIKKNSKTEQDAKQLHNFRDFLQKCLTLNPKDRITPQKAMQHPFLHYQTKLQH